jgi:hypothetical protein
MNMYRSAALSSALLLLASAAPAADTDSWVDRIAFKGDVRLRYEMIDLDQAENVNRMRFRTRFGFSAKVSDDVKFVLRLATGGGDPVSTNQTFDDGFSKKDIGVDQAYIDWRINDKLNFFGGKMKNPLFRAGGVPLVWDGDLNPEGLALAYKSGVFFGTVGGFSAEERSTGDDSLLYVAQAGATFPVGDAASLTAGAGYFAYTNTIGNLPFYNGRAKGNTVELVGTTQPVGTYVYEYKNTEVFAQLDTRFGDWPFKIFAHATQNNEVSTGDTAYAFGVTLGAAKGEGDMEFSWIYQDLEADSVIGTFSDSDFGGGGTNASGHILNARYAVSKKIALGGTLFVNEVNQASGPALDYNRVQLDIEFKFD